MLKLAAVLAAVVLAFPALAQEDDVAGDYASQIAPGTPLDIPPGIYAYSAQKLADFFAATKGARTIYADVLAADIRAGKPQMIVDTRPTTDYAAGHVPGAVNIPLDTLFRPENLARLPTDGTRVVIVCHTGHTASMALGGLVALGYNPYVLRFAMMGWNATSTQRIWSASAPQTIYGLPDNLKPPPQ
jgi:rhodanese-related sulfurtransferase